jgi:hypothetical protein
MEAVFPLGISRIFSDDFRTDPAGNYWNLLESSEKNPGNSDRNTASNFVVFSVASRPFPAVRRSPRDAWQNSNFLVYIMNTHHILHTIPLVLVIVLLNNIPEKIIGNLVQVQLCPVIEEENNPFCFRMLIYVLSLPRSTVMSSVYRSKRP